MPPKDNATATRNGKAARAKSKESKPRKPAKSKANKKGRRVLTARSADRHDLYQQSVQAPEVDIPFYRSFFKRYVGRPVRSLREDFCGTAFFACHWVLEHKEHRAIGVDLDRETLDWGRKHNVERLLDDEQRTRLQLLEEDVLTVRPEPVDLVIATNFSYTLFTTRDALRGYFANAREGLKPDGLLILDAWGGGETLLEQEDFRKQKGFTYVWDQHCYDPISNTSECRIHFEFKDGTRMKNAFKYFWRHWTLPELKELLEEAGYHDVHVLWEGTDKKTGDGNGKYYRAKKGDADPSWLAYIIASKAPHQGPQSATRTRNGD